MDIFFFRGAFTLSITVTVLLYEKENTFRPRRTDIGIMNESFGVVIKMNIGVQFYLFFYQ